MFLVILLAIAGPAVTAEYYDPRSRDFTGICTRNAQIAPANFCMLFEHCCSPELKLDPLNGDRCQNADKNNGCQQDQKVRMHCLSTVLQGAVVYASCKAYNCTTEVTTTTSPRPFFAVGGGTTACLSVGVLLVALFVHSRQDLF